MAHSFAVAILLLEVCAAASGTGNAAEDRLAKRAFKTNPLPHVDLDTTTNEKKRPSTSNATATARAVAAAKHDQAERDAAEIQEATAEIKEKEIQIERMKVKMLEEENKANEEVGRVKTEEAEEVAGMEDKMAKLVMRKESLALWRTVIILLMGILVGSGTTFITLSSVWKKYHLSDGVPTVQHDYVRFACAVFGAWLVHWTFGTFNCWGNVTPYITSYMRYRGCDVNYETTSKALSLAGICLGCSMYLGGKLQGVLGLRGSFLVGGWTLSLGVGLSSITVEHGMVPFLLTYAIMFGIGMGLGYTAPIVCLMKWMPDRKGLASGLVVFAFGSGGVIFDPVQVALVNPRNMEPTRREADGMYFDWEDPEVIHNVLERVPHMLLALAIIFAVMQLVGVLLLMNPLETPQTVRVTYVDDERQFSVRDMVKTKQFWLLFGNFLCNTQAVFFAITYSKIIAASTIKGGVSDAILTMIVAVGALINGMGRLFWGTFNDRMGFRKSMMTLCTVQSILVIIMPFCHFIYEYGLICWTVLFCDIFSLFPSATALYFGTKNIGANYGVVFLGFTFGMLIAPKVAQSVIEQWSLRGLCWTTAVFIICGGLLASQNRPPERRSRLSREHPSREDPLISERERSPIKLRSAGSVLNIDRLGLVVNSSMGSLAGAGDPTDAIKNTMINDSLHGA